MDAISNATTIEKSLVQKASQKRIPIGGSLEILPLCNMNCDMCYVRLSREEMERKGRIRTADEWLDLAKEMKEQGVLFLLLTGGEPFLYPEFQKLYSGLSKMGMIITINSNGTLIDEVIADFLAGQKPRRVNITLYGKDRVTYKKLCHYENGFEQALRGIRLLCERGIDVKLNGSLTKENRNDAEELIRIAEELQVPINIDTYMYPASRERECGFHAESRLDAKEAARAKIEIRRRMLGSKMFEEYRQQMKQISNLETPEQIDCSLKCRAGKSSFVINWKGNMTPCVMLEYPSQNVFEEGFGNAWEYISNQTEKIRISTICASCRKRKVCQTCAACALLETGAYDKVPQYMCEYTEEMLKQLE
ncbi:MAG: radical SAM protein [Dorea sp.]|nr:radical SAM protein [Dorea sp.]